MTRCWGWRLFLGCLVFVIIQVACRSPILPCSARSGRGRERKGGRGRGYGASLGALAPDRGIQTGAVESSHSVEAMSRFQTLWPMTLRGGDGEAGVDDEEEEGGESSSLDEMKIHEEAMKRGNEEELTGGIKDSFLKKVDPLPSNPQKGSAAHPAFVPLAAHTVDVAMWLCGCVDMVTTKRQQGQWTVGKGWRNDRGGDQMD